MSADTAVRIQEGIQSPAEIFLAGQLVEVYASESARLAPSAKERSSKLEPAGIGGHAELWKMLLKPATDERDLSRRQELITWLIDNPEESAKLSAYSHAAAGLSHAQDEFITAKSREVSGDRRREGDVDPVEAKRRYVKSLTGTFLLADTLDSSSHDFFVECGKRLRAPLEGAREALDADVIEKRIVEQKPMRKKVSKLTKQVSEDALEVNALPTFANHVQKEGFVPVTFTDDFKAQKLNSMWNPKFLTKAGDIFGDKKGQVANDTPITNEVAVLTGNNASGKTFHEEGRLFSQLAAQSFGYAPAEEAVIKPVSQLAVLERAQTNAAQGLSAFGSEVKTLARVLGAIERGGNGALVISDEGFSTTSPDDQAVLLKATHAWLRQNGASILAATHNEAYVDFVEAQDPDSLFHLPYKETVHEWEDRRIIVPTHQLEHGKDDARAIEVGRRYGLKENILERAQLYLEGDRTASPLPERKWFSVGELHPDTRRQSKLKEASLHALFPFENFAVADMHDIDGLDFRVKEPRSFIRSFISDDVGDTGQTRYLVGKQMRKKDPRSRDPLFRYTGTEGRFGGVYAYDNSVTYFEWQGKRSNDGGRMADLLTTGAVYDSAELIERQQFIEELQADHERAAEANEALEEIFRMYAWCKGEVTYEWEKKIYSQNHYALI